MNASLHESLRHEILRRVDTGEYKPGGRLPSTAALASEFSVSAITVKRALRDLQTSGVLRSVAGVGTFVRERQRFVRNLEFSLNSLEDAARLGLDASIELISVTREAVSEPGLLELDAPAGMMTCVRKLIAMDGARIMHDTTYLPIALDDELMEGVSHKLVLQVLKERGVAFTSSRLVIDAAPASREVCESFNILAGYPVLRRLYRLSTADPKCSVFGMAQSPFDRLACTIDLDLERGGKSA